MTNKTGIADNTIKSLEQRERQLNCLYDIEEILSNRNRDLDSIMHDLVKIIPKGFNDFKYTQIRIEIYERVYVSSSFESNECTMTANITMQEEKLGQICATNTNPKNNKFNFSKEEKKLLMTIADRIASYILFQKFSEINSELKNRKFDVIEKQKAEWKVILEMLKKTDQTLFSVISKKMLNHMFTKGIEESNELFRMLGSSVDLEENATAEINRPTKKQLLQNSYNLGMEIFTMASKYFSDEELLLKIQKWIHEEKSYFLVKATSNINTPLSEVADAIRRYHLNSSETQEQFSANIKGVKVSLIRRFLTDQLDFIEIAKHFVEIKDFYSLLHNLIYTAESHGALGGKSAGLFLAEKIIKKSAQYSNLLADVKYPKTWYITSDAMKSFMYYNNMEDILEQKYKDINDIRKEYPHIVQAFKNSHFPLVLVNGISRALDDFGDNPIIVRSSSLLEDRVGASFAGKYKSLFLANQGTKQQRIDALLDAIAEVYASVFSPDPIGYRNEKRLMDYNEEMSIMIQEVIGKKIGKYFFPAFSGVGFSHNEFRWTPRIKREDGLLRMVPGLGTRAVDRIGNDFPILLSPSKPDLKLNLSAKEMLNYSTSHIDLINLETNTFETKEIDEIVKETGTEFPLLNDIFSIYEEGFIKKPFGLGIDPKNDELIVTFDNLISKSPYIKQLDLILKELKDKLDRPVDIEFSCDGKNLYLLQCRPQNVASENVSATIPEDVPKEQIIFTANKFVSNGKVPNIAYLVYVDPDKYTDRPYQDLKDISKAVSKLNKLLPKKTFILMGPGRWGTRDDMRLGVKVSYSDINNTAGLIEIAKQKGSYTPELSFGTHFFLDLVESNIRYLPLYPDDDGVIFNYKFFNEAENTLTRFLPNYEHLEDILKVINIRETTNGNIVRLLMNADEEKAMALISDPNTNASYTSISNSEYSSGISDQLQDEPLQWRKRMAESIALKLDPDRFNVKSMYLFGTVFNESAAADADIDLIVILKNNDMKEELKLWFEGWDLSLSQINYNKSGYSVDPFIDVTYITEDELKEQKYYADLINPANHASKKLALTHEEYQKEK